MAEKKDVKACIRCASKDLKWASKSEEGIMTKEGMRFMGVEEKGTSIAYKCNACGYVENPVIFDSENDWKRFAELKKEEGKITKEKNASRRIAK
jgi:hypothetical protein